MESKYSVLSVTTLGALMAAIDSTIVFLALPDLGAYFHVGIEYLSLVIVMYLIATTALMIPSVGLANRFGKKRVYLLGFGLFTVSSFLIVVSPDILAVVALRAVEGAGAGIMASLGIPILMDAFGSGERGKAVGINSISWAIGTLVGPVLGGILVTLDWRYIFLINVPIGMAAMALGLERLPASEGNREQRVATANLAGFLLIIVPLVVGISFLSPYWLLGAAALAPVFLFTQRRQPIIPRELLRNRRYMLILGSTSFQALAFFGVLYALSIYFQNDLGMAPLVAGVALSSYPVASIVANPLGGYLLDKSGRGSLIMGAGVVLQGVSMMLVAFLLNDIPGVSLMLLLAGFGGSLYWAASTTLGIDIGAPRLRPAASGTLFTFRNIALVVGLALLPLFIAATSPSAARSGLLILDQNIDIARAVGTYVFFTGVLSMVAAALIIPYHHLSAKRSLGQGTAEGGPEGREEQEAGTALKTSDGHR